MSLRGRFLLVVLAGVGVPMAILGAWLTRSTKKSGEALLKNRLEESLTTAVYAIGNRWVDTRGPLTKLAESAGVQSALRSGRDPRTGSDQAAALALERDWAALDGIADVAVLRGSGGQSVVRLERATRPLPPAEGSSPVLPVSLPVFGSGDSIVGSLEFRVRLGALLPEQVSWAGVGGLVLALFDTSGTVPLLPMPMDPALFRRDRFRWGEGEWLVRSRQLEEPPLRLSLAAPMAPFAEPFARAAQQGTIALILVLSGALLLAAFLTRRLTGPLEQLADGSDAVAAGDLERQVTEEGPVEIRRVGRAFNAMTDSLRRTLRRLSQREAVAAVGEFAASLAHEMRNPLTAIRLDLENATQRLQDPVRARELIDRAVRQIDRLDATVSGSLRIARSGNLELIPLNVRAPLRAAIDAARPRFALRGGLIREVGDLETPALANANASALEQLFLNLLLNAADAVDAGGVAEARIDHGPGMIRISIADTGRGIAPADLPRVFEPFYTTTQGGTGLGLAIARRIAEAHGGELRLESELGRGTTAQLVLPLQRLP